MTGECPWSTYLFVMVVNMVVVSSLGVFKYHYVYVEKHIRCYPYGEGAIGNLKYMEKTEDNWNSKRGEECNRTLTQPLTSPFFMELCGQIMKLAINAFIGLGYIKDTFQTGFKKLIIKPALFDTAIFFQPFKSIL